MGDGSRTIRGLSFIKAFADSIVPNIGNAVGDKLEIVEEGLEYLEELAEVHYYVRVVSQKRPGILMTLVSRECIYAPEFDEESDDLFLEKIIDYSGLDKEVIELKLQEAGLR